MAMRGQMKIQQMAFMVMALFFFFVLVGLFVLGFSLKNIDKTALELERGEALGSLKTISSMSELSCGSRRSFCIDEDRAIVMSRSSFREKYSDFWPVSSIKVYRVYPKSRPVKCPAANCNYYEIFDNGQKNKREYSTFVLLCKMKSSGRYVYEDCSIGKLVVGVRSNE